MSQNVYLQVNEEIQRLGRCIIEKAGFENSEVVNISYNKSNSVFSLSRFRNDGIRLPLYHSLHCPAMRFASELGNLQTIAKKIPVLCSMIVKSQDLKVLILRKTEFMSIFPKVWSFPYGKVQIKESICKAGLRALREETAVNIFETPNDYMFGSARVEMRAVCAYESVFPKVLEYGLPRNQAILIFYEASLPCTSEEVIVRSNDTDYLLWISKEEWEEVQEGLDGRFSPIGKDHRLSYETMQGLSPNHIGEGISEGHSIALSLVFNSMEINNSL